MFQEGVCFRVESTERQGERERKRERGIERRRERERDAAPVHGHLRRRVKEKTQRR